MKVVTSALIGYSGFVGSNLLQQLTFDALYNSTNSSDMSGQSFDRVICAGVSAVKWLANQNPEQDRQGIERLTDILSTVHCKQFILISTVDVYADPSMPGDEDMIPTLANHPYGRHRFALETWCANHFESLSVVRLPGLFGSGLKKNIIFDLMNHHQTERIDPESGFQWYPVANLGSDIEKVEAEKLKVVNLVPEPLPTRMILDQCFPGVVVGPPSAKTLQYDLRTKHSEVFNGPNGYIMSADHVLEALRAYLSLGRAS